MFLRRDDVQTKYRHLWIKQGMIHLSLVLLLILATAPATMAVTFTDGDFTDPDWTLTAKTRPGFIAGTVSSSKQTTGGVGNSAYLQITTFTDVGQLITGYFIWGDAMYDPQTQGAIASVDYSEFSKEIYDQVSGVNQATGAALFQGGIFYQGGGAHTENTNWDQISLTGLTALNFIDNDYSGLHPDFSSSGDPINFGFYRANHISLMQIAGIDNWSVTVNPVPLPAAVWLLGSGLLALGAWRKLRKN